MQITPPTADQLLAIRVNAGIAELAGTDRFAAADAETVEAVVEGIGAFAAGEWAPLTRIGDREGARLEAGAVHLPDGYAAAYAHYVEQGWNAIAAPADWGGQALPQTLACAVLENLGEADFAFALLPMLTVGAIEALLHHGSDAQRAMYLGKLVSGEWSGTMNLTEPQAGSDVGALTTTATPITAGEHAGKYAIRGQKIYITWGEHDLAQNIIHLVLARTPDAPIGSRGISLFVVPKFHLDPDGGIGPRNDVACVGLEEKLGIHASPTCVMSYGEHDACVGELVGAEHAGLRAMFTMMNSARINVGSQGVQAAERALQQAHAYAADRIQSARAGAQDRTPVSIGEHPDVRRMLLRMRALTEGARALLYYATGCVDRAALGDKAMQARADLLVPLVKAWCTDIGVEVASLGIQVHGGMGFVEETGAAQHLRDARIAPIYEGTNGIQAADFVTRKLGLDQGGVLFGLLDAIEADVAGPGGGGAGEPGLADLVRACRAVGEWMLGTATIDDRLAGSVPFTAMVAVAVAGWQLVRQARAVDAQSPALARRKRVTVRFFLDRIVPEAAGLAAGATAGAGLLYELTSAELLA